MTKECADYLNATAGRWDKEKSDKAIEALKERMNRKTYVFTVTDCENSEKPTIYCQMSDSKAINDQETAEKLIAEYAAEHFDLYDNDQIAAELEDIAYAMRKNGAAWFKEQYCFELTEVNG